jgi:hypothetical protein
VPFVTTSREEASKPLDDPSDGAVRVGATSPTLALWFTTFLLKPFVSLVSRRMCMRIVRFWRSTYDVLMGFGFGLPIYHPPWCC